jgi:actin-related protein 6
MQQQNRVLVLDNGGYTCKVGWATDANPRSVYNFAVRPKRDNKIYVADQIEEVTDTSSLHYRYPMEKGVILNWDLQSQIWNRLLNIQETTAKDTHLMLLEAPLTLQVRTPYF